jgi:hypothetical protein
MDAVIGLVGALIGALAALAGQRIATKAEAQRQWVGTLHGRCAAIYALEHEADFAAWEALRGQFGRMDSWDFSARRMAEAEILLITCHAGLRSALEALTQTGRQLAVAVTDRANGGSTDGEIKDLRQEHRAALTMFEVEARSAIAARALVTM